MSLGFVLITLAVSMTAAPAAVAHHINRHKENDMGKKFADGQVVTHSRWTDPSGNPAKGTVRVNHDAAPGEAQAEVAWHGTCVADELDLVQDDIR